MSKSLERKENPLYNKRVNLSAAAELIKSALLRDIEANPSDWRGITNGAIDRIAALCANTISDAEVGKIRDASTANAIDLPPKPDVLYRDRAVKYGRKVSVEEFIDGEVWGRLREAKLLYSEFIRQADQSLYEAIVSKAQRNGLTLTEFAKGLGIMTRDIIRNPPPELVPNVRLIRAAQVKTTAKAASSMDVSERG